MTISKKTKEELIKLAKSYNSDSDKKEILDKIEEILLKDKPKKRTLTIRYSEAKKLFREFVKDENLIQKIKPDPKVTTEVFEENEKIRNTKTILEIKKETIEKILSFNMSNDVHKIAIFLLFTSGRRTSEISGFLIRQKPKTKYYTIKPLKRTDDVDCNFHVLVKKTTFNRNLSKFKKYYDMTNKNTFQRTLLRKIKKHLGKEYHPHSLRGMYAIYSFTHMNKKKLNMNGYIQKILCQQAITSSLSYNNYKIDFDEDIIKKSNL